ncbi:NHLP leader peptide family RiPP precursor [Ruegeria jejuensis]|uniref:NHLP leader peptide family RiPP precursor n=1 Tax=Ruegeria jejuensis TaxID=3233338 RepID=UPI00355C0F8C
MNNDTATHLPAAPMPRGEILNKAWTDEAFMAQLESDPRAALAAAGHNIPEDVEIKVVRDTGDTRFLHVPAAPEQGEISDSDLLNAQGGSTFVCVATAGIVISALGSAAGSASAVITLD